MSGLDNKNYSEKDSGNMFEDTLLQLNFLKDDILEPGFPDYSKYYENHKDFFDSFIKKWTTKNRLEISIPIRNGNNVIESVGFEITNELIKEGVLDKDSNIRVLVNLKQLQLGKVDISHKDSKGNHIAILNFEKLNSITQVTGLKPGKLFATILIQETCKECGNNESLSEITSQDILGSDFFRLRLKDFINVFGTSDGSPNSEGHSNLYKKMFEDYAAYLPEQIKAIQFESQLVKTLDAKVMNLFKDRKNIASNQLLTDAEKKNKYYELDTLEDRILVDFVTKNPNNPLIVIKKKNNLLTYSDANYLTIKRNFQKKYPNIFSDKAICKAQNNFKQKVLEKYRK